ncbi:ZrgA family zinc uptake protein [Oceanospirillum beijerinckii]|uniref:ZrgA family zinc uptake protein n=1 Tax=Oceanospirillum beijerinckii TaxID=64976 RepID=UPI0004288E29|nr:DUF2796 domain-containing protein [Oceanospirillum beijerinckii]
MFKKGLIALALTASAGVHAENFAAHEHGVANLMLSQEGNEVMVELDGAADSLLGFEHQPKTEAQEQAVIKLVKLLNTPDKLTSLAQKCKLVDTRLELPFAVAEHSHDDHKGHDDHDEHDHDEHNKDHDHDEHDHDKHNHAGHKDTTHSDIRVSYQFDCKGQDVENIQINLFANLPHLEELRAEAVSERRIMVANMDKDGMLKW